MTVHANPIRGFEGEDAYGPLGEPDDATITVQRTGRITHVTITPYFHGKPDTPMVLQLPTADFERL